MLKFYVFCYATIQIIWIVLSLQSIKIIKIVLHLMLSLIQFTKYPQTSASYAEENQIYERFLFNNVLYEENFWPFLLLDPLKREVFGIQVLRLRF